MPSQHIHFVLLGAAAPAVSSPKRRAKDVENSFVFRPLFLHPRPSQTEVVSTISILENNIDRSYRTMVMTEEQKKAKENAAKFITYLHKKYYSQIVEEIEKREEMRKRISSVILRKLGIPSFSYL